MGPIKFVLMAGLAVTVLQSCAALDRIEDRRRVRCGGQHRLSVVDLNLDPDPIGEGQRIRSWRVRLRADSSGECDTVIRIRESGGDELVGRDKAYRLRPGINNIEVNPVDRYRFSRSEHCFEVVADIEETRRRVDAARRFCARRTAARRWSMR